MVSKKKIIFSLLRRMRIFDNALKLIGLNRIFYLSKTTTKTVFFKNSENLQMLRQRLVPQ